MLDSHFKQLIFPPARALDKAGPIAEAASGMGQRVVLLGGSTGGVEAVKEISAALPADFPAAILIVVHIGARVSHLPAILQNSCLLRVSHAEDGDPLLPGHILVAPPDCHLTVAFNGIEPQARLCRGPKENHTRPAIDPLFRSAAAVLGRRVIAAILSGYMCDGAAGLDAVKARGGYAIVQDPSNAEVSEMPTCAIARTSVDQILALSDIAPMLTELVKQPITSGRGGNKV